MKRLPRTGDRYIAHHVDMHYRVIDIPSKGRYNIEVIKGGNTAYDDGETETVMLGWFEDDELQPNFIDYAERILCNNK
jgi:hypothetical protein